MAKRMTARMELLDSIRIVQGLLEQERFWASPNKVTRYVRARREAIAKAEREIAEAEKRHATAPGRIERLQRDLKRASQRLVEQDNRCKLDRLARLVRELNELSG